jgi:hypothetical protein
MAKTNSAKRMGPSSAVALPLLIRSCVLSHPYSVLAEDGASVFGEHGFGASRYLLNTVRRGEREVHVI